MQVSSLSRQPSRPAWMIECLLHKCSILLGMVIERFTHQSYSSALNSYLTFCKLHEFDITPTPETLSLYIIYQSSFIKPKSVDTYLLGIANQMEKVFPEVRQNQNSALISRTLKGALRRHSKPIHCKRPLFLDNLKTIVDDIGLSTDHDNLLFIAKILIGFHVLLRLAKLCFP